MTNDPKSVPAISLVSSNPYSGLLPNLRILWRDELVLMKMLRAEGWAVLLEPDDGRPIGYVFQKGWLPALQPLILKISGIALDLLVGVTSAWIYDWLKLRNKTENPDHEQIEKAGAEIALEVTDAGIKVRHSAAGAKIEDKQFREILKLAQTTMTALRPIAQTVSPYPVLPIPIYLEHSAKIIGWGRVNLNGANLEIEEALIEDDDTLARVRAGDLRGASISGIAEKTQCSICGQDWIFCDHLTNRKYSGIDCVNSIQKFKLIEISIVKEPTNLECLIKFKKN